MPIQVNEESGGAVLAIHVSGKLVAADYEHFVPEFERLVRLHGKLRVLFDMTGFHGWTAGAVWEDTKFAMHHFARHRPPGDGRREEMAGRDGDVLQAVYESDGSILRSHRRRRGAAVVGRGVEAPTRDRRE